MYRGGSVARRTPSARHRTGCDTGALRRCPHPSCSRRAKAQNTERVNRLPVPISASFQGLFSSSGPRVPIKTKGCFGPGSRGTQTFRSRVFTEPESTVTERKRPPAPLRKQYSISLWHPEHPDVEPVTVKSRQTKPTVCLNYGAHVPQINLKRGNVYRNRTLLKEGHKKYIPHSKHAVNRQHPSIRPAVLWTSPVSRAEGLFLQRFSDHQRLQRLQSGYGT